MSNKNSTAVVIPNWDGIDMIGECLTSLETQSLVVTIVVVDNGSKDGSVDFIKTKFPEVTLLELPENTGFTGGVNTGIKYALKHDYEFIVLFNNDALASKDWVKNLVQAAQNDESAGIVTGKFMLMDKKHLDSTGDILSIWGLPFPRGRNELDTGQFDLPEYVFGATGGATLYRTKMLRKIGIFDDNFFAYFEDVDMSFRAQLAGWKVLYTPDAVAYHHLSQTSSRHGSFARYHSIKNFILLYNKNMPGWLFWKYKPLFFIQLARMKIGAIRDKQLGVFIKAVFAGIKLTPSTLKKRRQIQANKKVSTEYIDGLLYHSRPPKIKHIASKKSANRVN